jgi:HEAT repeat protein
VIGRLGHGDKAAAQAVGDVLTSKLRKEHGDARAVAALAAGRIGDPALVPVLRRCLGSSYDVTRLNAALSLGMLGDKESAPKIRDWLSIVGDENYRGVAAEALGHLKDKDSGPALEAALAAEPFPWVRTEIEGALTRIRAQ